jgi:hypothetical protein
MSISSISEQPSQEQSVTGVVEFKINQEVSNTATDLCVVDVERMAMVDERLNGEVLKLITRRTHTHPINARSYEKRPRTHSVRAASLSPGEERWPPLTLEVKCVETGLNFSFSERSCT